MTKDDRDPTLLGIVLGRARERAGAAPALSELADNAVLDVPAYGTEEAIEERARLNGEMGKHFQPRLRPAGDTDRG